MKKNLLKSILALMALFIISFPALTNKNGAPAGKTGSPLSNGQTCYSCHSGPSVSTQGVTISSDIPTDGYLDNTSYTITITSDAGSAGMSTAGFEASVEKAGSHQGSLTASSGTQLKQSNFVTHTSSSTSASNGVKSWSFSWNSATGSDSVTVYAAGLFANGNNQNSGDALVTSSLEFKKSHVGLGESSSLIELSASPNPAQNVLRLSAPDAHAEGQLTVVDALGRVVLDSPWNAQDASGRVLEVTYWPTGIYTALIRLNTGTNAQVRFQVLH
ncbi:MAG: T9SS type A sorting domain-containing protein [Schleiferiaceae bacterium]|nr:T9SS type A sorting domain-containing protein [Schleiferiaceae bacterium]